MQTSDFKMWSMEPKDYRCLWGPARSKPSSQIHNILFGIWLQTYSLSIHILSPEPCLYLTVAKRPSPELSQAYPSDLPTCLCVTTVIPTKYVAKWQSSSCFYSLWIHLCNGRLDLFYSHSILTPREGPGT